MNKSENDILQQDLSKEADHPGMVFIIHLFMKKKCEMPSKETMLSIMNKHLDDVECFCHSDKLAGFAPSKYKTEFKNGAVPPQLLVMECIETEKFSIDSITKSQMWDCKNSEEILQQCKYHVVATDMLAGAMTDYRERADMLMDFTEALVEMYPECEAVFFQNSGKMFAREKIACHSIPRNDRFIYFAVNVRFFNIQGTDDKLIDSLGMSTLYLPDIQYHFHGMDPNWVVNHAYNLLSYIYDNNAPINSGETVDGIENGNMSDNIQWKCRYENALIQPAREVLDICMNEYASGNRED